MQIKVWICDVCGREYDERQYEDGQIREMEIMNNSTKELEWADVCMLCNGDDA